MFNHELTKKGSTIKKKGGGVFLLPFSPRFSECFGNYHINHVKHAGAGRTPRLLGPGWPLGLTRLGYSIPMRPRAG